MKLENNYLKVEVSADGTICIARLRDNVCFIQVPRQMKPLSVIEQHDGISLDYVLGKLPVQMTVRLAEDNPHAVSVTLEGDGAMPEDLSLPFPWKSVENDVIVLPYFEGVACRADEELFDSAKTDFPMCSSEAALGVFGVMRPHESACLFTAVGETYDAWLRISRNENRLLQSQVIWKSVKGQFGYTREIRYFLTDTLADFARDYRAWRNRQGLVKTLTEKAKHTPAVRQLAGAADVWLWDDNNMNWLYGRPELKEVTRRDVKRVAEEMIERGMNHVLWNSFEGETPADCSRLEKLGFLVGKYDIYRDVLPKTLTDVAIPYRRKRSVNTKYWPQIVRREANGDLARAWQIHGLDGEMHWQNAVCEIPALKLTMENVPPDVEHVGYNSRFIDVQASAALRECYDPMHPTTRRDSARYIRTQMEFLGDIGLVGGVENGQECLVGCYHFAEGLMSPGCFRAYESGRKMTTLYRGEDIPKVFIEKMLNPLYRIPLWELVYHDCVVNYWYWGDSSNCCPDLMPRRDIFNALYGTPPLYSLSMTQWDELKDDIAASYHRATPVAALTAFSRMIDFQWLTSDGLVQKTTFENTVEVTANFADEPREIAGILLPPLSAWVKDAHGKGQLITTSN